MEVGDTSEKLTRYPDRFDPSSQPSCRFDSGNYSIIDCATIPAVLSPRPSGKRRFSGSMKPKIPESVCLTGLAMIAEPLSSVHQPEILGAVLGIPSCAPEGSEGILIEVRAAPSALMRERH